MPTLTLYFHDQFKDEAWRGLSYLLETPVDEQGHGESGEWVLGRHPASDLTIAVRNVSKRHASIVYSYAADRWSIQDLNSSQGTFLNGQQLNPGQLYPLKISDRLYVAANLITVVEDEQDTVNDDAGPPTVASTEPIDYRPAAVATAPAPPPSPPATYADNVQFALHWLATPTTRLGGAVRLVVVALVALVLVLVFD